MVTVIQNQKVEKRRDAMAVSPALPGRPFAKNRETAPWGGSAARQDPLFGVRSISDPDPDFSTERLRTIWQARESRRGKNLLASLDGQSFPLALALMLACLSLLVWWVQPNSLLQGLQYCSMLKLPMDSSSDRLMLEYASTMDEDTLISVNDDFDPAKLEVLHVQDYVVQPGDSLSSVAKRYNLNIDTIISFNNISDPRRIRTGQTYHIPNRDGLQYVTRPGDTLEKIAKKFDVGVTALLDGNNLSSEDLAPKTTLFIPGARLNPTDLKLMLGELFSWPVRGFYLTSTFGYRSDPFTGQRRFHNGQDIGAYQGAPILAASAGRVVDVESQLGNYGKVVIIQHDRGFQTLYAHMDSFAVSQGQYVSQGQMIGRMGNTGRSTGTHLHFSVIKNGVFVNPRKYLP